MSVKKNSGKTPRRSNGELARDRKIISDMYLRGYTQVEIAERIKRDQSTVSRDIKALQKQWLQDSMVDFNEARAKELAKIDALEMEYWKAWQASQQDAETIVEEASELKDGTRAKVSTKTVGQTGDPRYLQGVQWCIDKRAEILGLDAPERFDITSGGEQMQGNIINVYEYPSSGPEAS